MISQINLDPDALLNILKEESVGAVIGLLGDKNNERAVQRIIAYVEQQHLIAYQHQTMGLPISVLESFARAGLRINYVNRHEHVEQLMDVSLSDGHEITLCNAQAPEETWVILSWSPKLGRKLIDALASDMAKSWAKELAARKMAEAAKPRR